MAVKKVSNKERRRRQNENLRRLLTPKNALMVLNEMLPNDQLANVSAACMGGGTLRAIHFHFRSPLSPAHCARCKKGFGLARLSSNLLGIITVIECGSATGGIHLISQFFTNFNQKCARMWCNLLGTLICVKSCAKLFSFVLFFQRITLFCSNSKWSLPTRITASSTASAPTSPWPEPHTRAMVSFSVIYVQV